LLLDEQMSQAEAQQHGVMPIHQQPPPPGAPVVSVANPPILQVPQSLASFPQIALPLQGQVVGAMPMRAPMVLYQSGALLQHQMQPQQLLPPPLEQLHQQTEGSQP
jgi:hypothetical protein